VHETIKSLSNCIQGHILISHNNAQVVTFQNSVNAWDQDMYQHFLNDKNKPQSKVSHIKSQ
jgi:hypothetical protein